MRRHGTSPRVELIDQMQKVHCSSYHCYKEGWLRILLRGDKKQGRQKRTKVLRTVRGKVLALFGEGMSLGIHFIMNLSFTRASTCAVAFVLRIA